MTNETMYHPDGTRVTWTHRQFQTYLLRLTPEERAYVLHQRKRLGIDTEKPMPDLTIVPRSHPDWVPFGCGACEWRNREQVRQCAGCRSQGLWELIRVRYPDAYVRLDQTAKDCGYWKPWMVWSHEDSDARLLGEGTTEQEAIQDAERNL